MTKPGMARPVVLDVLNRLLNLQPVLKVRSVTVTLAERLMPIRPMPAAVFPAAVIRGRRNVSMAALFLSPAPIPGSRRRSVAAAAK